jgi:ligand-binding sensor domain-containing protein/two-component sensor histidine kinase
MNRGVRMNMTFALVAYVGLGASGLFALDPNKRLTQYSRSIWTQAEGLPQDSISAITQTENGYLWLGTEDGLTRFDGYDFLTLTKDFGLPSNSIRALTAGNDGTLWIGTPNGLVSYRAGRFSTFTTKDGLPDNFITSLFEDHEGILWVTAGIYLSRFDNGKFTTYPSENLLPVRAARAVYEDRQHTLWVAGVGGLVKLSHGHFVPVLGPAEMHGDLATMIITVIVEDSNNRLWMGGNKGLIVRTAEGKLAKFDARDGLPDNMVRALWADQGGNLWVGTNTSLSRFEHGRFVVAAQGVGRNQDWVRCLFEDREGDLWVGMNNGLNRFRDDRFTIYGRTEGLPSDEPVAVHQDRAGKIWVGYHGDGLVAFDDLRASDDHKFRVYSTRDGLSSNEIFSIRETDSGDLLVSTREGLSWMHDSRFTNYVLRDSLSRSLVFDALQDRRGRVWAATSGGVYRMTDGKFHRVVSGGSIFNGAAVVLAEGIDSSIWVGIYAEGLWRIQDGKTQRFTTKDGLGSDAIRSLYQDKDGTLWIGTFDGGLNAFRDGVFTRYTAKDGLLSDNVSHVDDDGRGFLWLSTTTGICRIAKKQLYDFAAGRIRKLDPINYGLADGLRSAQCAPGFPVGGGGTRTSDGRLWFPTSRGLAVIDAAGAGREQSAPAPLLQILEVTVSGQDIDLSRRASLKPDQDHIQFRYSAIHLSAPERLRYDYKLEGLDRDWIVAGPRRVADYNSLRHGQYRFLVRASIPGRPAEEAFTSFSLTVLPHFYERQYFLWLCAASFLGAIYGVHQLRLKQVHDRFSLVLGERARMARELHDTLAQGLVGISSQLDAVAMKMNGNDVARQHLRFAQKMARYSLTEARRSVMDLRAAALEQQNLSSALAKAAGNWTAGSDVRIEIDLSNEDRKLPEDVEQNVLRITQEAVANAVKHSGAKHIRIWLRVEARRLQLSVKDDGRGFELPAAFSTTGEHFGLLGMRERAERLGGELILLSEPNKGTEVAVSVPLSPNKERTGTWRRLLDRFNFAGPMRS